MTIEQITELRNQTLEAPVSREENGQQEIFFWLEGAKEFSIMVEIDVVNSYYVDDLPKWSQHHTSDNEQPEIEVLNVFNTEGDKIELDEECEEELVAIMLEKS